MRKVLKVYHIHSWKAFWSFSSNFLVTNPAKKEQQPRLPITLFVIWAVCGFWLLLNIHLQSSRTYIKKIELSGLKVSLHHWLLCFAFSSTLFLSFLFFFRIFLPCFYFFSVEKVLRTTNAFRIIGLERLKLCRWVVEIDFQGNLCIFMPIQLSFERSFPPVHVKVVCNHLKWWRQEGMCAFIFWICKGKGNVLKMRMLQCT